MWRKSTDVTSIGQIQWPRNSHLLNQESGTGDLRRARVFVATAGVCSAAVDANGRARRGRQVMVAVTVSRVTSPIATRSARRHGIGGIRSYLLHMGFTGLDGGIMVVLAAGLWLVYLMPTWFKRREYAAVEKTEIRRQQAMRVLEETAPIPVRERVQSIVTPSGQIADRDKLAEAIQRSKQAQAARVASRQFAEETTGSGQSAAAKLRIARRLRRTRAWVTMVLLAAVITIAIQVVLMAATGIAAGAWTVLGFGAVAGVVSFAALGRLASIARRRQTVVVQKARPERTRIVEEPRAVAAPITTWTPVAVPKPMYLTRSEAPAAESTVNHLEQLRAAARESDRALREAQESPEVTPITKPEEPVAAPSRYASMGVLDAADVAGPDLDAAMRRRRSA